MQVFQGCSCVACDAEATGPWEFGVVRDETEIAATHVLKDKVELVEDGRRAVESNYVGMVNLTAGRGAQAKSRRLISRTKNKHKKKEKKKDKRANEKSRADTRSRKNGTATSR